MSYNNSVAKSLKILGNVTMAHVKDVNKSGGPQWLSAINIASQAVQSDVRTLSPAQGRLPVASILISSSSRLSMVFKLRMSSPNRKQLNSG
jgi:hypothetical protein